MRVRLSLGSSWMQQKGMRTATWCVVVAGLVAGSGLTAYAESTPVTRTTLAATTDDAGPRTRTTLTAHVTTTDLRALPSGVVTFRAGDRELGSALLDSAGNASLKTDTLPAGDHQVVAMYQGEPHFQASASAPSQVHANVSTVAGFSIAAAPTALTTVVGGFVSTVVTVTPVNGFSGYVSLSCEGLPVNTTCTFSPVAVPAVCGTVCTPGTSTMQIQTQTPSPGATSGLRTDDSTPRYVFVLPALFGLLGLGARKKRGWRNLALVMATFAGLLSMSACAQRYRYLNHGPEKNPGTPIGAYTVVVESQSSTGSQTTTPPTNPQLTLTVTAPKS